MTISLTIQIRGYLLQKYSVSIRKFSVAKPNLDCYITCSMLTNFEVLPCPNKVLLVAAGHVLALQPSVVFSIKLSTSHYCCALQSRPLDS